MADMSNTLEASFLDYFFVPGAAADGAFAAATGRDDGTAWIAAHSDDAEAAHLGSLTGTMAERNGLPGTYALEFSGADLTAALSGRVGQVVYEIVAFGADLRTASPRIVRPARPV